MSSFDNNERLMELIEEDIFSVSEFGDRQYLQDWKQSAPEEDQPMAAAKTCYPENEKLERRRRREESTPVLDEISLKIKNQRIATVLNKLNNSEQYQNESLLKLYEKHAIKPIATVDDTQKMELKNEKQNEQSKTENKIENNAEMIEPSEERKEEEVKPEVPKKRIIDKRGRNAMLVALKNNSALNSDPKLLSDNDNYHEPDEIIDKKSKTVIKVLPERSNEKIDVTERFKDVLSPRREEISETSSSSNSSTVESITFAKTRKRTSNRRQTSVSSKSVSNFCPEKPK